MSVSSALAAGCKDFSNSLGQPFGVVVTPGASRLLLLPLAFGPLLPSARVAVAVEAGRRLRLGLAAGVDFGVWGFGQIGGDHCVGFVSLVKIGRHRFRFVAGVRWSVVDHL